MTNFHCYLMIGLTGFFIFWLLLLLRDFAFLHLDINYYTGWDQILQQLY